MRKKNPIPDFGIFISVCFQPRGNQGQLEIIIVSHVTCKAIIQNVMFKLVFDLNLVFDFSDISTLYV